MGLARVRRGSIEALVLSLTSFHTERRVGRKRRCRVRVVCVSCAGGCGSRLPRMRFTGFFFFSFTSQRSRLVSHRPNPNTCFAARRVPPHDVGSPSSVRPFSSLSLPTWPRFTSSACMLLAIFPALPAEKLFTEISVATPNRFARAALSCWSHAFGTIIWGVPVVNATAVVPTPPLCTTPATPGCDSTKRKSQ